MNRDKKNVFPTLLAFLVLSSSSFSFFSVSFSPVLFYSCSAFQTVWCLQFVENEPEFIAVGSGRERLCVDLLVSSCLLLFSQPCVYTATSAHFPSQQQLSAHRPINLLSISFILLFFFRFFFFSDDHSLLMLVGWLSCTGCCCRSMNARQTGPGSGTPSPSTIYFFRFFFSFA